MRSLKTLLSLTLFGCLVILASTPVRSAGQEPGGAALAAGDAQGPRLLELPPIQPGTIKRLEATPPTDARLAAEEKPTQDAGTETKSQPATEGKTDTEPQTKPESKPASKPELSKEMTALRDRLRQASALCYRLPFNTRDNTPGEIIDFCLAYGCYTEITDATSGKKVNGVGALCWNFPCAGYELLMVDNGRFVPRIGYGVQQQPSELLAFLAMSMVNPDYEIRAGNQRGTVADLVTQEKLTCRSGGSLAFKLIGLAYYVTDEKTWSNQLGETWSVQRLVNEELARSANASSYDVTDRLMALSFAVSRCGKRDQPIEGALRRAQDHVTDCQQFALDLQNADGTWNADFFALKGNSSDLTGTLRATGRILEWLAFSLPEDRLQEPRVLRSVGYLANVLGNQASGWNLGGMTPREIDAVMHAVHALSLYDQRVFAPFDPEKAPAAEKKAGSTAQRLPVRPNRFTAKPSATTR